MKILVVLLFSFLSLTSMAQFGAEDSRRLLEITRNVFAENPHPAWENPILKQYTDLLNTLNESGGVPTPDHIRRVGIHIESLLPAIPQELLNKLPEKLKTDPKWYEPGEWKKVMQNFIIRWLRKNLTLELLAGVQQTYLINIEREVVFKKELANSIRQFHKNIQEAVAIFVKEKYGASASNDLTQDMIQEFETSIWERGFPLEEVFPENQLISLRQKVETYYGEHGMEIVSEIFATHLEEVRASELKVVNHLLLDTKELEIKREARVRSK